MKNINQFISEKFKINSNTAHKNNEELVKDILEHFSINESDQWSDYIHDWVNKYDVKKVRYIGDIETLEEGRNAGMNEKILDDFDTDSEAVIDCQDELEKCEDVLDDLGLSIKYNENIIAYLSDTGGLYAWKTK